MTEPQKYYTTIEAAELLRYKPSTLAMWRSQATGPAYIKLGHTVRYRLEDLVAWMTAGPLNRRVLEESADCHRTQRAKHKRPRGRAGALFRAGQLAREPDCRDCAAGGVTRRAEQVDHIIPVAFNGTNDPENLRSLCRNCHWMRTREQRRRYGRPCKKSQLVELDE